ncbi:MAG: hypothetical protein ACREPY_06725, partial [Rhodanobacteraceae bacterium]
MKSQAMEGRSGTSWRRIAGVSRRFVVQRSRMIAKYRKVRPWKAALVFRGGELLRFARFVTQRSRMIAKNRKVRAGGPFWVLHGAGLPDVFRRFVTQRSGMIAK